METSTLVVLEIALREPEREEELLAWWQQARAHLAERARLTRGELAVLERGRYLVTLGFPLPGGWSFIVRDRRWRELAAKRPPARIRTRKARLWHAEEPVRDVTTGELRRWLDQGAGGGAPVALVDVLPRDSFEAQHLPGAVNLPLQEIDAASAARVLGDDLDRPIVVYCSSYG